LPVVFAIGNLPLTIDVLVKFTLGTLALAQTRLPDGGQVAGRPGKT